MNNDGQYPFPNSPKMNVHIPTVVAADISGTKIFLPPRLPCVLQSQLAIVNDMGGGNYRR
jgi:hypothetical protein